MSHGHLRRALYVVGPERAARLTGHEHLHLKRLLWSWHSSVEIEFRVSADLSSELLNTDEEQGRASAAESPSPTGDRYLIVFVEEGADPGHGRGGRPVERRAGLTVENQISEIRTVF